MYVEGQFFIYIPCFLYIKLMKANVLVRSKSAEYYSLDKFFSSLRLM